jgi:transcriptional regulator with XRE-family HTH domain
MSQRCLGKHAGITGAYVGKLELGRSTPSVPIVSQLAAALEVDFAELWPAARPSVPPDDPELQDLIERSGADDLPEPRRQQLKRQLWESLELKRARQQDETSQRRRAERERELG